MKLIAHHHFVEARKDLMRILDRQMRGRLIFVCGPTGVGKTTLRHSALRQIAGSPRNWGRGHLPIIEVYALLSAGAYFSSKAFAERLVSELHAPKLTWLIEEGAKTEPEVTHLIEEVAVAKAQLDALRLGNRSEPRLWRDFENMVEARMTIVVSIEQSASMCVNHKNKEAADHILNLMALGERSQLIFVFTGVPAMSELWITRSEIRRRSDFVWVPPYNALIAEDMSHFLALLRTLERDYAFEKGVLRLMSQDIMAATAGIYAEIQQLFGRAHDAALRDGREHIAKRDLESSVYNDATLRMMWDDVRYFEELREAGSTKPFKRLIARPPIAKTCA